MTDDVKLPKDFGKEPDTGHLFEYHGCPCLYTIPCHLRCTCVMSVSSSGCRRCCSYGSKEQRTVMAIYLAKILDEHTNSLTEND